MYYNTFSQILLKSFFSIAGILAAIMLEYAVIHTVTGQMNWMPTLMYVFAGGIIFSIWQFARMTTNSYGQN